MTRVPMSLCIQVPTRIEKTGAHTHTHTHANTHMVNIYIPSRRMYIYIYIYTHIFNDPIQPYE